MCEKYVLANLAVSLSVSGQEVKLPTATDLHSHGVTQDQIDSHSRMLRKTVEPPFCTC